MVHISGVVWERVGGGGFVGQQYPNFNAPLRKKMKNHQRELASTAFFFFFSR